MTIFILIFIGVSFIASVIIEKKVFPSIFAETSINPFNFFQKAIVAVMGVAIFLFIPSESGVDSEMLTYGIITEVACTVMLILLNLKYKKASMIAKVTATHLVYGVAFSVKFFFWIILLAANFAGLALGRGGNSGSGMPKLFGSFNVSAYKNTVSDAENESAEAYAKKQGFSSADEAEEFGIDTGKMY